VVLYFAQLWEERRILNRKALALAKKADAKESEVNLLEKQKHEWAIAALINTAYFPMTIHWSLENSSFPELGVGLCGTVAAVAQLYSAWKSTP
jgi:hypothetical protein